MIFALAWRDNILGWGAATGNWRNISLGVLLSLLVLGDFCIDGNKVRAGDAVNFSIGQGDTLVTPLRLAQIYAAIANNGTYYKPQVARAIVDVDGKLVKEFKPEVADTIKIEQSTWDFLHRSLRMVVTRGTGAGVFSGFPIEISGKTGTAQVFGKNPNGSAKDDTSWFASYGPTENPQYAVVMMVSQGGFGAYNSYAQRGGFHVIEHQLASALELFPIFSRAHLLRTWGGIVDIAPDASPILGLTPVEHLYINSGWGTGGFKATPGSGWAFADTIAHNRPHDLVKPYSLDRFVSGHLIDEHGAAGVAH